MCDILSVFHVLFRFFSWDLSRNIKSISALGLKIFYDQKATSVIILKFDWESRHNILISFSAFCAQNFYAWLETNFATRICTREMVEWLLALLICSVVWADECCALKIAHSTLIMTEMLEGEKEVAQLRADNRVFARLINFRCPHRTINMHELIHLEWN